MALSRREEKLIQLKGELEMLQELAVEAMNTDDDIGRSEQEIDFNRAYLRSIIDSITELEQQIADLQKPQ